MTPREVHAPAPRRLRPRIGLWATLLLVAASASSFQSGCRGRSITIPNNQPPTVTASATPLNGNPPITVSFTATASDPDGRIVDVLWDFKDGATSSSLTPSHQYTSIGNYDASVTVRDEWGATDSRTVPINVSSNNRPVANAGADQLNRNPGVTFTVTGSATDADGWQTLSYQWTQVGGPVVTLNTATTPTTTFTTPTQTTATYTLRLTVTDNGTPQLNGTDDVVLSIRVTYTNTTAAIFSSRCDGPSITGATCHGVSGLRQRLNSYSGVSANLAGIQTRLSPGGSMESYATASERAIILAWITNGAPQ